MSQEASKLRERWKRDGSWDKYFGNPATRVLDIGCGDDKIIPTAEGWDLPQGDGQLLRGVGDGSYDIVFSSHFGEHLRDPLEGLLNQWRVLRPGGYLIFLVPDEDTYEQGVWPSLFNTDHKFTYAIAKDVTWSPCSKNVIDLIGLLPKHKIISLRTCDDGYDHADPKVYDQTDVRKAEAAIEVIVQKEPWTPDLQSALKQTFRCPKCMRSQFLVRGITAEGKLDSWCTSCGLVGHIEVKPDDFTNTSETKEIVLA